MGELETVLVVEDNEQNLYLMTYLLRARGYETVAARDGREGIAAAERKKFEYLFLFAPRGVRLHMDGGSTPPIDTGQGQIRCRKSPQIG